MLSPLDLEAATHSRFSSGLPAGFFPMSSAGLLHTGMLQGLGRGTVLFSIYTHSLGDPAWSRLKPSIGHWLPNAYLLSRTSSQTPHSHRHLPACHFHRMSSRHLKLQCPKLDSSPLPPNLFCRFLHSVYSNFTLPTIWALNLEASPIPIFLSHLISDSQSILLALPSTFTQNLYHFSPPPGLPLQSKPLSPLMDYCNSLLTTFPVSNLPFLVYSKCSQSLFLFF